MPIELVIFLCVGILMMVGMFSYEWFYEDRLTGPTIGLGLLMILLWPVGLLIWVCVAICEICGDDFVIKRRKK